MANKVTIEVEARFVDHVTGNTKSAEKAINDIGKALDEAQEGIDGLNGKKIKPAIDAEDDSFAQKVKEAEERASRLGETRADVLLGATDHASETIGQAQSKAERFADRVYSAALRVRESTAYQAITKVKSALESIANTAWTATIKVKDFATAPLRKLKDSLFSVKTLAAGIMGNWAVNKFVKSPVKQYADYEDLVTQFGVLLGSQDAAEQRMADLVKFAGQTPFTRDQIFQASRVLQTYTNGALATPDATGGLKMIGDVAAATGQDYERVANYFGRLYNEVGRGGEALGEPLMMLREIGALSAENEERIKKIATGSGTIEEKWAKIAGEFSKTDGMMEAMSNQMNNLLLGVKSFVKNNLWMRLGKGISESLKPFLADFRTWRNENGELISGWADRIQEFAKVVSGRALDGVRNLAKRADELFRSDAFKEASLSGKIRMTWNAIVADPLTEWWNGGGREKTAAAAGRIGDAAGSMLSGAILGVLGFTSLSTQIGADGGSVANAFVQGFLNGFDGDAIKAAIKETVSDVWGTFKESSLGGKIVSAAILAKLGNKYLGPLFKLGGGLYKGGKGLFQGGKGLYKWLTGRRKGAGDAGGLPQSVATMHVSAGVVYVNGPTVGGTGGMGWPTPTPTGPTLFPKPLLAGGAAAPLALPGEVAGGAGSAAGGGALAKLSRFAGSALRLASGAFAGITVLRGAQEAYRGRKLVDEGDTLHGNTTQAKGYSKWGGVAAGAALGSIVPGVGTALGAGAGALGGWLIGPVLDKSEKLATHAKQIHNSVKGTIGEARSLGRAFEEAPLFDDTPAMKMTNALERAKFKAGIGEYKDVYREPTIKDRVKSYFEGPHQTQSKGRQFELPVSVTAKAQGAGGDITSGILDRVNQVKEKLTNIDPIKAEVPAEIDPKVSEGAGKGLSGITDWMSKIKEKLGMTDPITAEPDVQITPTYTVENTGENPITEIEANVPDTTQASTTCTIDTSYVNNGFFSPADIAPEPSYSFGTTASVNPSYSVSSRFSGSAAMFGVNASYALGTAAHINPSYNVGNKFNGSASTFGVKASYAFSTAVSVVARVATTIIGNPSADIAAWKKSHVPTSAGKFRGGIVGGSSAMSSFARGGLIDTASVQRFSDGGMVRGGSRLIQVAEEGSPEMVIPLSSQRRDRGRKLWEKAGEMLKVPGFAQGGLTGGGSIEPLRPYDAATASVSPGETHIEVGGVTVQITVQAAPGGSVTDEVTSRRDEIVDTVAAAIAEALEAGFANTPVRGGLAG